MEKHTVSIWISNFKTKEELKAYVETDYKKRKSTSQFWKDFKITRADTDLQEVTWKKNTKTIEALLERCSYVDDFIDQLKESTATLDLEKYNSAILMIDNEYSGQIKNTGDTLFIGNFTFKHKKPDYMKNLFK